MFSKLVKQTSTFSTLMKRLALQPKMNFAVIRKYSKEHEWIEYDEEAKTGLVGITSHAANELGDIVHIEFPDIGTKFAIGQSIGSIESVKVAADVFAPVDGEVAKINEAVNEDPALVNSDPNLNWFLKINVASVKQINDLLTEEQYLKLLQDIKEHGAAH